MALFACEQVSEATVSLLEAAGAPRQIARKVASVLVDADLAGYRTHGVFTLPACLDAIMSGAVQPTAEPTVAIDRQQFLSVDGRHGLGHYAQSKVMEWAIERALQNGMCCATLARAGHIGRLGGYVEAAAHRGCLAFLSSASCNIPDEAVVAPHRGSQRLLGTNPVALAIPTSEDSPFILDFSTAATSYFAVALAREERTVLPERCILDREGRLVNDPSAFYEGGAILPFAGHKGFALSILTCLLAALAEPIEQTAGAVQGNFLAVVDIGRYVDLGVYQARVRTVLDIIQRSRHLHETKPVLIPGDGTRQRKEHNFRNGISLTDSLVSALRQWALRLGLGSSLLV